jgi:hypothetical protein
LFRIAPVLDLSGGAFELLLPAFAGSRISLAVPSGSLSGLRRVLIFLAAVDILPTLACSQNLWRCLSINLRFASVADLFSGAGETLIRPSTAVISCKEP